MFWRCRKNRPREYGLLGIEVVERRYLMHSRTRHIYVDDSVEMRIGSLTRLRLSTEAINYYEKQ